MAEEARPDFLASGELARLIPTLADSSKEARTTSIFLAALMAVPPFARLVMGSAGLRLGKLARIECYTEVVLLDDSTGGRGRPDGLITVSTGRQQWRALVEAKCGNAVLEDTQVESYLEIARRNKIDAVITISNQLAALPTHHPLTRIKRSPKGPALFHWSWMYLLTEATLLISQSPKEFDDPEQRYILSEVVRFFRHPNSGVARFDRMNAEWKDVVAAVQNRATLARTSPEVINTVASWHQAQRNICLQLSRKLGRNVELSLSRNHKDDPDARLRDDCETLTGEGQLTFTVNVPDAAAPIKITADLARRNITCSISLDAPQDRKSTAARVNWLTRQIQETTNENIQLRATWPGRATPTQIGLARARENPDSLQNPNSSTPVNSLEVLMIHDIAGDFGRNAKFVERLESVLPEFYEQVALHLRAWVPAPPKLNSDILAKPETKAVLQDASAQPTQRDEPPHSDAEDLNADPREYDAHSAPSATDERHVAANLSVEAAMSTDEFKTESTEVPLADTP
jgi:hypothetical protein